MRVSLRDDSARKAAMRRSCESVSLAAASLRSISRWTSSGFSSRVEPPSRSRRRVRRREPADCRKRRLAAGANCRCRGIGSSERGRHARRARSSALSCSRTRRTRKVPGAGWDRPSCAGRSADFPPGAVAPARTRTPRRWPERATSIPRGGARCARSGAEPFPPCAARCGCGAPACRCRRSSDRPPSIHRPRSSE